MASDAASEGQDPVMAEIERELLHESFDERRPVTVEQGDAAKRPLLRNTVGKGLRLRPEKLPAQCFVALFCCADDFAAQRRQVMLQFTEGGLCGSLERRIDRRYGRDD